MLIHFKYLHEGITNNFPLFLWVDGSVECISSSFSWVWVIRVTINVSLPIKECVSRPDHWSRNGKIKSEFSQKMEDYYYYYLRFMAQQEYFTPFELSQSLGGAKMGDPREKIYDHWQAELGLSHMWPELGLNRQRWDDEWFRGLKISMQWKIKFHDFALIFPWLGKQFLWSF